MPLALGLGLGMPLQDVPPIPAWAMAADLWEDYTTGSGTLSDPTDTHASTIYAPNAAGLLLPFAPNVLTRTDLGLHTAPTRTTLVAVDPIDFSSWSLSNLAVTVNTTAAPDGTITADRLDDGVATGVHSAIGGFPVTSGTSYAASFFVKDIDRRFVQILFGSGGHGATAYANFDLQAGTLGTVGAGIIAARMTAFGTWWLVEASAAATATTGGSAQLVLITSATSARAENYTGASKSVYAWDGQAEVGTYAASRILTAGATVSGNQQVVSGLGTQFAPGFEFNWQFQLLGQDGATKRAFVFSNGAANDVVRIDIASTGILTAISGSGGVFDGSCALATPLVVGAINNLVLSCGPNYLRMANNADVGVTDTSVTYPAISQLAPGGNGFNATDNAYLRTRKETLKFRAQNNTTWAEAVDRQAQMAAA